jgi:hypothetical protein
MKKFFAALAIITLGAALSGCCCWKKCGASKVKTEVASCNSCRSCDKKPAIVEVDVIEIDEDDFDAEDGK